MRGQHSKIAIGFRGQGRGLCRGNDDGGLCDAGVGLIGPGQSGVVRILAGTFETGLVLYCRVVAGVRDCVDADLDLLLWSSIFANCCQRLEAQGPDWFLVACEVRNKGQASAAGGPETRKYRGAARATFSTVFSECAEVYFERPSINRHVSAGIGKPNCVGQAVQSPTCQRH